MVSEAVARFFTASEGISELDLIVSRSPDMAFWKKGDRVMQPLDGMRVLDMTRAMAGPFCTMMLGDLGADIIKVERPGRGDESRGWGPPFVGTPYGPYPGESAYFISANRNKRSITINLKSSEGQDIVRRLAARSDALVENFRTGVLDRMGLGYDQLRSVNPRLVYCSISGYGSTGPYAARPGYDFIIQAEGGFMGITGPEEGPPSRVGVPIIDITAGMFSAVAILAALRARDATGEGQHIDLSLLETQVALLTNVASNHLIGSMEHRRLGNTHPNITPYEAFPARDRWFALAAANERQWSILCQVLGRSDLKEDPRFADNNARVANRAALREVLDEAFQARDAGEWLAEFRQAGLPCGPINTIPEVFDHPQAEIRSLTLDVEHPTAGMVQFPGFPYKFSSTPAQVRLPPPLLGQHTEEVLGDMLGFSASEVVRLREEEIV
jgi:crotonobetainyl-CoA:carnitine CoA-transferase CaiB-like acyl-CoA transferase